VEPDWLANAVFYQIYPQSFADGNGDGVGDLPGLIDRLDDVAALGVNALWLNPIFDSPFLDAGYDVRDFYRVAARYGGNDDVRRLCREAHARGMRVCLDLVAGHTSWDHPGFLASARPERNEWTDRFVWSDDPWMTREGDTTFVSGVFDRHGAYAVNFFAHQPALNYGFAQRRSAWQQAPDDPGPRANVAMLKDVLGFWFEHGVDGFRCDIAATLIKRDPQSMAVRHLWREIRAWMDAAWPGRALIAEWARPEIAIDAGFHVDFMLHFGVPGYPELFFDGSGPGRRRDGRQGCYFERAGRGDFREFERAWRLQHRAVTGQGAIGLPSANHDFQRPASQGRDADDLAVIFTFLLTWPCVPFIYYGDEIGMRYQPGLPSKEGGFHRTGSRTPMQWDGSVNAGFSAAAPERHYLPLDPDPDRPDVVSQRADRHSLWQHVHALVRARRSRAALAVDADCERLDDGPGYPLAYVRRGRGERVLVVLQPAAAQASVALPAGWDVESTLAARGCRLEGGRVVLDGPAAGAFALSAERAGA